MQKSTFTVTTLLMIMRSIFIRLAVVESQSAKSREVLRKFELTAVQGHPDHRSWCQSKAHIRLPISD